MNTKTYGKHISVMQNYSLLERETKCLNQRRVYQRIKIQSFGDKKKKKKKEKPAKQERYLDSTWACQG